VMNAFNTGLSSSIFCKHARVSSTGESLRDRNASANSGIVAEFGIAQNIIVELSAKTRDVSL